MQHHFPRSPKAVWLILLALHSLGFSLWQQSLCQLLDQPLLAKLSLVLLDLYYIPTADLHDSWLVKLLVVRERVLVVKGEDTCSLKEHGSAFVILYLWRAYCLARGYLDFVDVFALFLVAGAVEASGFLDGAESLEFVGERLRAVVCFGLKLARLLS